TCGGHVRRHAFERTQPREKTRTWASAIGYREPLSPAFGRRRMHVILRVARNRRWFDGVVLSAALLAAGCAVERAPAKDLGADIDEVATTLVEQPLLHSASIGVVYRGREFIRHRGDMETGKP